MTAPAWIPTTAIPNVEVLPHWQAKYYTPGGIISVDAIVWHFAEGGGTDTWLLHPTNDNSSHIVLKYSGAIRQMVSFYDASHSLHIDRPDGPPGPGDDGLFSLDAVQRALGTGWRDPNTQIVTIEIEGFAANGPSADQKTTIRLLGRYLESIFPNAVHLGHRDFQNYKPCPGRLLFNEVLPHEGRLSADTVTETTMATITRTVEAGTYTIPANKSITGIKLDTNGNISERKVWAARDTASSAHYGYRCTISSIQGNPFILATDGFYAGYFISTGQVALFPDPVPTQAALDAAIAAQETIQLALDTAIAAQKTAEASLAAKTATAKEAATSLEETAAKLAA